MSRKVFLVGDGAVGSNFANDLLQNAKVDELAIFEVAKDRPVGDAMDWKISLHSWVKPTFIQLTTAMPRMPTFV
ncbi:hypothetical protein LHEJCM1062_19080 [Lactobacillus helveticus]|uniref:Lactate/malate dehydrogenase N-terminal domain-containing protein n=1 Tax=Lactobacillus helveticus TaxID=1587 RepID=A0AAV4E6P8_LACHE|nr:hypothetical protein LHEJCM1007_10870 [Lactobacillus helveticus]GFP14036.1 hypothetical protein LHEJCM1062_19080 [Lactobacillus helveticus]